MKKFLLLVCVSLISIVTKAQVPNIPAKDASRYIDKVVTVCDSVYSVKALEKMTLLNFGGDYPNAPLTLVVYAADKSKFPIDPAKSKRICITGMIKLYNGKPQIVLTDQGMIEPYRTGVNRYDGAITIPDAASGGDDDVIYTNVDEWPSFKGGIEAFNKYIEKNMIYPKAAKEAGIQGRVTVNFIVEKDGSLTEIRVLRGLPFECDAEARRLIKSSPKFIPGKNNGKPVRVSYTIPVVFKLMGK